MQYAFNDDVAQGIPYAIGQAEKLMEDNDRLMVVCGDILFNPGYTGALERVRGQDGAVVFTSYLEDTAGFGLLRTKSDLVIEIFPKDKERHIGGHIELGTCLLPSDVFEKIKGLQASGRELGFGDVYQLYLNEQRLYFSSVDGWWSDVGNSVEEYKRVCEKYSGLETQDP
jgi:NDP-sugar pyrophosphorylase family protein